MTANRWEAIRRLRLDAPCWWADGDELHDLALYAAVYTEIPELCEAPERARYLADSDNDLLARAWLRRVQGALRERGEVAR
jgi:hypothetical protein